MGEVVLRHPRIRVDGVAYPLGEIPGSSESSERGTCENLGLQYKGADYEYSLGRKAIVSKDGNTVALKFQSMVTDRIDRSQAFAWNGSTRSH